MSSTQTTERSVSFEEAKARLKEQSITSAVQWAKSLKLMKAEKAALKFQFKYLDEVLTVIEGQMLKVKDDEELFNALLQMIGERSKFVGKKQEIDGKPYQPIIGFPEKFVLKDGTEITDVFRIGAIKLEMLMNKAKDIRTDIHELRHSETLLVAKQRFYRYCYNRDIDNMKSEHQKISEFESSQLDTYTEKDRDGTLQNIVFHNSGMMSDDCSEFDSQLELGMKVREKEAEHTFKSNGNYIREYGDRIKHAYEIRQGMIKTAAMFNNATPEDKLAKYSMKTIVETVAQGSIPNLF